MRYNTPTINAAFDSPMNNAKSGFLKMTIRNRNKSMNNPYSFGCDMFNIDSNVCVDC